MNEVPNRLKVTTKDAFVRTGLTARNLTTSSSGSRIRNHLSFEERTFSHVPEQNQIKSRLKNMHSDKVPK